MPGRRPSAESGEYSAADLAARGTVRKSGFRAAPWADARTAYRMGRDGIARAGRSAAIIAAGSWNLKRGSVCRKWTKCGERAGKPGLVLDRVHCAPRRARSRRGRARGSRRATRRAWCWRGRRCDTAPPVRQCRKPDAGARLGQVFGLQERGQPPVGRDHFVAHGGGKRRVDTGAVGRRNRVWNIARTAP